MFDIEVTKKAIESGERVFMRFGSTRLLSLGMGLGFLYFLVQMEKALASEAMQLGGIGVLVTLASYVLRPHSGHKKNQTEDPPVSPMVKVIAGVLVFIALLLALAVATHAEEAPADGLWNPDKVTQAEKWRAIKKQQDAYQEAKAKAYKTHKDEDYAAAESQAMFPMQKAWLFNNRAYHYIEANKGKYTVKGLKAAERWLQQAFHYCWLEEARVDGPSGTRALLEKLNNNLTFVRTRLGEM